MIVARAEMQFRCEIEDFVETHHGKLWAIFRLHVLRGVHVLRRIYVGDRP